MNTIKVSGYINDEVTLTPDERELLTRLRSECLAANVAYTAARKAYREAVLCIVGKDGWPTPDSSSVAEDGDGVLTVNFT